MLSYLHIKNMAIIEELEVEFNEGLSVLTGETGVGKSVIINAINFALGAKLNKDVIRAGADFACCEISFSVKDEMLELIKDTYDIEDEEILISRTLNTSGKSVFKINGMLASSSMVKNITNKLIDIHGQHEHQSLFAVSKHIDVLDMFCIKELKDTKDSLKKEYENYKGIEDKIKALGFDEAERERRIDLLNFQINEIESARLKSGEEEELLKRREILINSDKISNGLNSTYESLDIATEKLVHAIYELDKLKTSDERFSFMSESLNEASIVADDIKKDVSSYIDNITFDEEEQNMVEERLDTIDKLKRKYGNTIDEILAYKEKTQLELDSILGSDELLSMLKLERETSYKRLEKLASDLSKIRKKNAKVIEKKIEENLKDLEMKNIKFIINISEKETLDSNGIDKVEFLFSSNAGEEPKHLEKIASGGEVSRVMLAIKNVLADSDDIETLIFDEIDTGISGRAAQKVAEKMNELSLSHQIICITHLPQIAAMADTHYNIYKEEKAGKTASSIRKLMAEDEVQEITRLVSGAKVTDTTLKHAKELKLQADSYKSNVKK